MPYNNAPIIIGAVSACVDSLAIILCWIPVWGTVIAGSIMGVLCMSGFGIALLIGKSHKYNRGITVVAYIILCFSALCEKSQN